MSFSSSVTSIHEALLGMEQHLKIVVEQWYTVVNAAWSIMNHDAWWLYVSDCHDGLPPLETTGSCSCGLFLNQTAFALQVLVRLLTGRQNPSVGHRVGRFCVSIHRVPPWTSSSYVLCRFLALATDNSLCMDNVPSLLGCIMLYIPTDQPFADGTLGAKLLCP